MFDGNPEIGASEYINWLDSRPSEPIELQICDVCGDDKEYFIKAFGGYCCVDCIGNDNALPYYLNEHDNTEEVYEWYENLKLK